MVSCLAICFYIQDIALQIQSSNSNFEIGGQSHFSWKSSHITLKRANLHYKHSKLHYKESKYKLHEKKHI